MFLYRLSIAILLASLVSCGSKELKTPSGYDVEILDSGSGQAAVKDDYVFFTLTIKGDDGKVLQEMPEGPNIPIVQLPDVEESSENPNPVIEVLQGSKVGGHYVVKIPVDSIPNAPMDVLAMKHVAYEIMVKDIRNQEGYDAYMKEITEEKQRKIAASAGKRNEIEELVKTTISDYTGGILKTQSTPSGLKYYILKEGDGSNAVDGNKVTVQYFGSLLNGTSFDDSFKRGEGIPLTLGVGQVIKGWDEGLTYFNKGAKGFLFIPSDLAYGEAGSPPIIGPNEELVFYIEMEEIQ